MSQAFTGVAVRIYIKGKLVGYATGVSIRESHNNVYVEVLGQYDPVEVVPTGRRMAISCQLVRILDAGLVATGAWPTGSNEDLINWPETTFEVFHLTSKRVLWHLGGIRAESRSWSIDKNSLSMINASFLATSITDESGVG